MWQFGKDSAQNAAGAGAKVQDAQRRMSKVPRLDVGEDCFDEKLSFGSWVERVWSYAERKAPEFAAAEDSGDGLASEAPCGEVCDPGRLFHGNGGVPVENETAGVAPACFGGQYARVEHGVFKPRLFEHTAQLAGGSAQRGLPFFRCQTASGLLKHERCCARRRAGLPDAR